MVNTNDLTPQTSGSASIGVNQANGGFNTDIRPYANIHMNSGIWHDILYGNSGVIRFAMKPDLSYRESHDSEIHYHIAGIQTAFELSVDGGNYFPLRLGATRVLDDGNSEVPAFKRVAIISTQNNSQDDLNIVSSGEMQVIAYKGLHFNAMGNLLDQPGTSFKVDARNEVSINCGGIFNVNAENDIAFNSVENIDFNPYDIGRTLSYVRYGDASSPHEAWHVRYNQFTGGPLAIGLWPIAHSGQVAQMIEQATPGGSVDLQTAYDNGNEIDPLRNGVLGYRGVLVRETIPGFIPNYTTNADITANKPSKYGIAVSGHTLTPTNFNSFAFASLNSNSLMIASSGTPSELSRSFFLGFAAANASLVFFNCDGSLRFAVGDTTGAGLGGQIDFRPFGGSGRLEYRFGSHQSWHMRTTANTGGPLNDGYWPIAHSGMMLEQINRAIKTKFITIQNPALNNDLTLWYTNEAITIHEVESVVRGTADASGSFAIRYSPNRSLPGTELTTNAIQCTNRSTGQITTSFAAPNIPADSWVWIGVSGVSGVATSQLSVTLQYR